MLYGPQPAVTCDDNIWLGKSKGVQLEIPMVFIKSTSASTLVVCHPNGNTKLETGKPVVSPILGTDKQF